MVQKKFLSSFWGIGSAKYSLAVENLPARRRDQEERAPMLANYLFCALAGTTWYFQFFFYTMGETQMGRYRSSSWTLHMASIIIFSSLWGIGLKEWKGGESKLAACSRWLYACSWDQL